MVRACSEQCVSLFDLPRRKWKNKSMSVICTIDVHKRVYLRLCIPFHVLCGLQSLYPPQGAASFVCSVMLTLKGNIAAYKLKICDSVLFSGPAGHCGLLLAGVGFFLS